jgi:hypothetical protein
MTSKRQILVATRLRLIRTLYPTKLSIQEIAAQMGVDRAKVTHYAKRAGLPLRNPRKPEAIRQEVIRLYQAEQLDMRQITRRAGMPKVDCVRQILTEAGVAIRQREHFFKEDIFADPPSFTAAHAYVLGFIATDGCIRIKRNYRALRIGLKYSDRKLLRDVANFFGYDGDLFVDWDKVKGKWHKRATLTLYSKRLVEDLAALGIGPRKSFTVQAWRGPDHLVPSYWLGCFDGDGGWCRRDGRFDMGFCGTLDMVTAFVDFVEKLSGVRPSVRPHGKTEGIFRTRFGQLGVTQAVTRLMWRDSPICLERKQRVADAVLATSCPVTMEKDELQQLLVKHHGRLYGVARETGRAFQTLQHWCRRYGLDWHSYAIAAPKSPSA